MLILHFMLMFPKITFTPEAFKIQVNNHLEDDRRES